MAPGSKSAAAGAHFQALLAGLLFRCLGPLHAAASEGTSDPLDGTLVCVEQLLQSDTPRLILGKPGGDILAACSRSKLGSYTQVAALFDARLGEVFDAFAGVGQAEAVGTNMDPSIVEHMTRIFKGPPLGQVSFDICMPLACTPDEMPWALYLIWVLKLPHLAGYAQSIIAGQPLIYTQGSHEELMQVDQGEDRAHWEETVGKTVRSVITLDHVHSELQAHVAALSHAVEQLARAKEVLAEHSHSLGMKGLAVNRASYNQLLVYSYQALAHRANEDMHFDIAIPTAGLASMWLAAEKSEDLTGRLFRAGAELGLERFVVEAARDAWRSGWPIRRPSTAEAAFPNAGGREVPVYHLREVCVRDLARETEYLDTGKAISTGRRLELLTVGLQREAAEELDGRPLSGRFVITHLADPDELAGYLKGRRVRAIPGKTLFVYDGHKQSARCPDCANIEHAFVDDLLLELAAWYLDGGVVDNLVVNLLASIGHPSPKAWFAEVVRSVAGQVPITEMQAGDVLCFEHVIVNFHSCPYAFEDEELLWREGSLHASLSMPDVLAWARERVWASVGVDEQRRDFVMFARQSEGNSVKRRQWQGYEAVAEELHAQVVDFAGMSFWEEVQTMRAAEVFATVPGAHHAAVLFMRPGTAWVELQCSRVAEAFYWYRGFRRLVAALGVRFESMEAKECPELAEGASMDMGKVWIATESHPISIFGKVFGGRVIATPRLLCWWRQMPPSQEADAREGQEMLQDREAALEFASSEAEGMERCLHWEQDCQSMRPSPTQPGRWELLRSSKGIWKRRACAEVKGGSVQLIDRTTLVQHDLYDQDLVAPDDAALRIRQHRLRS